MSASEKERENMSLYSVLLVDDEEEVFQVIMKKLDWEGMGFSQTQKQNLRAMQETVWKRLRWRRSFPWMSS